MEYQVSTNRVCPPELAPLYLEDISGSCFGGRFDISVYSMDDERAERATIRRRIDKKGPKCIELPISGFRCFEWSGRTTVHVGDTLDLVPGRQAIHVRSSGDWNITFTQK